VPKKNFWKGLYSFLHGADNVVLVLVGGGFTFCLHPEANFIGSF